MRSSFLILPVVLAMTGCSAVKEEKLSQAYQIDYDQVVPVKETAPDGAIFGRAQTGFFLGDRRAQRVGDVLTIVLSETTAASKSNDASLTRKGSETIALPGALFGAGALNIPAVRSGALDMSDDSKFNGTGAANQSNSLNGRLTVVVTRVYENGNLWVQGEKKLTLNQGEEFVRVAGLIRPEDILPGNNVDSSRIAQAQISYTGSGSVHDSTKQGWWGQIMTQISPI